MTKRPEKLARTIIGVASIIALAVVAAFAQTTNFTAMAPLPQFPPAPDVVLRDSFGQGPNMMRPASGKGTLKDTYLGASIGGFWLEYPGTKNNRWTAPDSGDTWRYCGTAMNPYQLPSPLETVFGWEQNAIVCTILNAQPDLTVRPTALRPVPSNLTVPYELEIDGTYWNVANTYLALGLTNSGSTTNNLSSGGSIVLILKPSPDGWTSVYEFRLGGFGGQLLASGSTDDLFFNQMKIRYNPQNRSVGASINGVDLGTFATNIAPPRYAGFEGNGYADNFVIKQLH